MFLFVIFPWLLLRKPATYFATVAEIIYPPAV